MKILITTGIFPPEPGGPATYSAELATRLVSSGHEVKVVTFADSAEDVSGTYSFDVLRIKREGKLKNFFYMRRVLTKEIQNFDVVYTLDWFTVGLPLALVCKKLNKKYLVRVGGGYIWEKYLRSEKGPMALLQFYQKNLYKNFPVMYNIINYVFKNAEKVVFNTEMQKALFENYYKFKSTGTIWNPLPEPIDGLKRGEPNNEIVFAGRLIAMKNVEVLIEGYKKSGIGERLVIIGDGPSRQRLEHRAQGTEKISFEGSMRREDLYKRIINSKLVVIPSWTDISPNQVYELLSMQIPFLLTKENYLPIYKKIPLMVDPGDSDDVAEKLRYLSKEENYDSFARDFKNIQYENSWEDVVSEHEELFSAML